MTQQHFSIEHDVDFRRSVKRKLTEARKRQAELVAQSKALNDEMIRQASIVAALELLDQENSLAVPMLPKERKRMGRPPGNQSERMPVRLPGCANLIVKDAVLMVLNGGRMSADQIMKAIWEINSQEDANRARATLNSDIARLVNQGRLVKTYDPQHGPMFERAEAASAAS